MARLDEIAELLCVNSRWLRTGEGVKHPGTSIINDSTCTASSDTTQPTSKMNTMTLGTTFLNIPFHSEVLSACGSGKTHIAEIPDAKVQLNSSILNAAGINPEHALCVPMIGNSMGHKIQSGSTIAIDCSLTQVVDGEIYALEQDGMLRIKYVYRLPSDGLRLRSHNHNEYPEETYTSEQIQALRIRILGWVFWWSTLNTCRPSVPNPLFE